MDFSFLLTLTDNLWVSWGKTYLTVPLLKALTLIRLRGVLTGHQLHNSFAISTWIEIMRSPLVTFNFKAFPKHMLTQIWKFLAQIWEMLGQRQTVSIDLDKKIEKIWFFQLFFKQIILFLFEIEFCVKNAFFRGVACWQCSKITRLGNFAHF